MYAKWQVSWSRWFSYRILYPLLKAVFEDSSDSSVLTPTLRQASISLLLKKGKDPLSCSSYRPISLLNVDIKILAKVLALHLESVLPTIISPDQTGFIKNRKSFFNVRRVFNILYSSSLSQHPEVLLSLDAEKAFDQMEWGYMLYALCRFGFDDVFISWIKLLYTSPLASVRTNDTLSSYFLLQRRTRQGCPLSPLLFALAMEPLAISIWHCTDIKGIFRANQEHKIRYMPMMSFSLFLTPFHLSRIFSTCLRNLVDSLTINLILIKVNFYRLPLLPDKYIFTLCHLK